MKLSLRSLLLVALTCSVQLAVANPYYQLKINMGEEANVPRGLDSMHEKDDNFVGVEFSAGKLFQLALNDTLSIGGQVFSSHFDEMDGFDTIGLGTSISYSHKFGFGAFSPRIGALLSIATMNCREMHVIATY